MIICPKKDYRARKRGRERERERRGGGAVEAD